MRNKIIFLLVLTLLTVGAVFGQKKDVSGKICGNPNIKCKTDNTMFSAWDIKFEIPKTSIIAQSEAFYAIILKSKSVTDVFGGEDKCKAIDTETERSATQKLFPNNKVFSQRCGYDSLYYTGVKENTVFLAVYGGLTLTQAQNVLKMVNKSGKYKSAYIKKLRAEFNGT